ncbi:hypothetical protein [Actinomadura flavalba]|uniref:hypothetical protein n=1 Tax=Actinomadura flavalba TaxID=1120938 RepID=UPI00036000C2|nr:hypothetical protein [Actinomadura flavalba]
MTTAPYRVDDRDDPLGHACALLRLCVRDAEVTGVLLALVLAGVAARLAAGTGPAGLVLLAGPAVPFGVAAGCAVRARRGMLAALGEFRGRTGAPAEPDVPWTPSSLGAALPAAVRDTELRRLAAAAHRCCALAAAALAWALGTAVVFLAWTLIAAEIPVR